ncbi:MAG: hypothetical protein JRI34_07010 [Deltaproteobacteria bacterium]|nr:hypothetical protein [Deltaproteobacteria bacterium]
MADDIYVNLGTRQDPNFEKLSTLFRVDDWVTAFSQNSYRGHVFCPDDSTTRKKIGEAAKGILEDKFGLRFKESALSLCNIED